MSGQITFPVRRVHTYYQSLVKQNNLLECHPDNFKSNKKLQIFNVKMIGIKIQVMRNIIFKSIFNVLVYKIQQHFMNTTM